MNLTSAVWRGCSGPLRGQGSRAIGTRRRLQGQAAVWRDGLGVGRGPGEMARRRRSRAGPRTSGAGCPCSFPTTCRGRAPGWKCSRSGPTGQEDPPGAFHVTLSSEARSEDVRITLPPARAPANVLAARRQTARGGVVKPSAMAPSSEPIVRFYLNVPDALASQLALRTDQDGKVEIPYLGTNDAPALDDQHRDSGYSGGSVAAQP